MSENHVTFHHWKPVDVLIVTALLEERQAVLELLADFNPEQVGKSPIYYVCVLPTQMGECRVAVTQLTNMGNVEAGIHATRAIDELNPTYVLMVGIAAGIRERVELGDVLVCTQVFYYEQAKQTQKGIELRPIYIPSDHHLLHNAQNYSDASWCTLLAQEASQINKGRSPNVHYGTFAVGDKVVADRGFVSKLLDWHPKLIGVEMESYGVAAAAAQATSRPCFLAIRGVSDFANEHKDDSYRHYASRSAAAFAIGFLRSGYFLTSTLRRADAQFLSEQSPAFIAIRHFSMQCIPTQSVIDSLLPQFANRNVIELLIDQTDLYSDGRLCDPFVAAKRLTNLECHVDQLLDTYPDASIGYFSIAHIPLLFYAGHRLTNKRKLQFFEFNRYTQLWEFLQGKGEYPELTMEGVLDQVNDQHGDVVIRISISSSVGIDEVAKVVTSPIASLQLRLTPTQRDVLVNEDQLQSYGFKFRRILDQVHEYFPNRERTHIFYAGPVSLAVYFGQLIIPTIDRRVVVYNYTAKDSPKYSWGLEITTDVDEADFLVLTQKTEGVA